MRTRLLPLVLAGAVLAACRSTDGSARAGYLDLGDWRREVTAASPEAELWFSRGLLSSFGFNHQEGVRCFERALELDPDMAMARWGIAYALGPNYNNVAMDADASARAVRELELTGEHIASLSPVESALVRALERRYASPPPDDRSPLDRAYAIAMRELRLAYPDDPDVAALTAEAVMILRPWKLWSPDGTPAPETPEVRGILEPALERWPDHPALTHLYIHLMEASPTPELALPAADRLRHRVPDAGHLVHMPSHIDVRLGHYEDVIRANVRAIAADEKFVEREGRDNFYTLYRLHNLHFLTYGAMFDGQSRLALETARRVADEIPPQMLAGMPQWLEGFVPTPLHVLVRFGRWEEILREPEPPANQPFTRAVWHYARALSFAALQQADEAADEHAELIAAIPLVPETYTLFNNTCADVIAIAERMAAGEVAFRQGRHDAAFEALRQAVERDDALNYDEPWGWMQPARHALGALLLERGKAAEAELVYRRDLERYPHNPWSLHGLAESLRLLGRAGEAKVYERELEAALARADVPVTASCFCRVGG